MVLKTVAGALCAGLLLTGCEVVQEPAVAADVPEQGVETVEKEDGTKVHYVPVRYWINSAEQSQIPHRFLDALNAVRENNELPSVGLEKSLIAAAKTHSKDMSRQNRPWHFGSDGSSPIDRAERAGFEGMVFGELISESFETDLATLSAWLDEAGSRALLLNPKAEQIGISWHQEQGGKIWWTVLVGA